MIEKALADGRIDGQVLSYLRSRNQRYRWLSLIFAGLHRLDEMGNDYQSAFYAQTEHVRVGYLNEAETQRLIVDPISTVNLDYATALLDEIYRQTAGQPYLIQRICWELVNQWNDRFLEEGEATPRVLMPSDLEPVITADFFAAAGYYFDGVWQNISEDEQQVLVLLAAEPADHRTTETLAAALGWPRTRVEAALTKLRQHDVIPHDPNDIRIAGELMRRWIEQK